jgi:phosphatidate cytidylyltransferase
MVAEYLKGEAAIGIVVVVTVVVSLLWYLGVERARSTANLAATVLGFLWVGLLGSFAALLLSPALFPDRHGEAFFLGAVIATVAYDVGALVVGSQMGRHPLAPAVSPNKTWEGIVGGTVVCLIVTALLVGRIHPWGTANAVALGIVVCVVAPLGDLCESVVKRDLRVKDMGSILPGHGGVLDRLDALLFVIPATFFLVRLLHIGVG